MLNSLPPPSRRKLPPCQMLTSLWAYMYVPELQAWLVVPRVEALGEKLRIHQLGCGSSLRVTLLAFVYVNALYWLAVPCNV